MSARDEVLARIRSAHDAAPPPDLAYEDISRDYRMTSGLDHGALVGLLVDRLRDYRALVRQCAPDDLTATIATALSERDVHSIIVPRVRRRRR